MRTLPRVEATYSFKQCWMPIHLQQGRDRYRPSMLLLMDEDRGLPVAVRMARKRVKPAGVLDWILQKLEDPTGPEARRGLPRALLVEESDLMAPLRSGLQGVTLRHGGGTPALGDFTEQFGTRYKDNAAYCVAEMCGESAALSFYRSAREFFGCAPWRLLGRGQCLRFDCRQDRQVVAFTMDHGGGLSLFCERGEQVRGRLGLFDPLRTHSTDLNLMDRYGINFGERYPALCDAAQPVTRESLADTHWLLQAIPEFVRCGQVLEDGDRRLGLLQPSQAGSRCSE